MKLRLLGFLLSFGIISLFYNSANASTYGGSTYKIENFSSLIEKYQSAHLPTFDQLKKSKWTYVGIANDMSLKINKEYKDKFDENGIQNSDESIMTYSFESHSHPVFAVTLVKRNFLESNRSHYISIRTSLESQSIYYMFSASPSGKDKNIYYIQNCRISKKPKQEILICPLTLKLKDSAPENYKTPEILEAKDKIIAIQIFKN